MKVKFICLNLWLGGKLLEQILSFLEREKPDILAVQEVYDSKGGLEERFRSTAIIKKFCAFKYHFFSPSCTAVFPDKKIPAGNAIFSKFPIVDSDTIFTFSSFAEVDNYEDPTETDFSLVPRNLQHAKININNVRLDVFNTQGIWGKNNEDSADRLRMSELIVREVKNRENVILAGDFNVTSNSKTIRNIEKYLNNVFSGELETTFNIKRKDDSIYSCLVVDMIFGSHALKITSRYCPDVDISDHLPLVITLNI